MNVDAEIRVAMLDIEAAISFRLFDGDRRIQRSIADAKAWLRYWPTPVPNHRSAGQFLRHMRERNAKIRMVQPDSPVSVSAGSAHDSETAGGLNGHHDANFTRLPQDDPRRSEERGPALAYAPRGTLAGDRS